MTKRRGGYALALSVSAMLLSCQAQVGEGEDVAAHAEELSYSGECVYFHREGMGVFPGGEYLDAYRSHDGDVVMRAIEDDGTQLWCLTGGVLADGAPFYTVQHQTFDGQYLDAYENGSDFKAVLRDRQTDGSQYWVVEELGQAGQPSTGRRLWQRSSGRYLDARVSATYDHRAVTRPFQDDGSQDWEFQR